MKKLTKEQVFEQLVDNASAELEGLDNALLSARQRRWHNRRQLP